MGQEKTSRERHTIDRCDGRFRDRNVLAEDGEEVGRGHLKPLVGHLPQIGAGAEGTLARAGQDQHLGVRVIVESACGFPKPRPHRPAQRVVAALVVDRDPRDRAVELVTDRLHQRTPALHPATTIKSMLFLDHILVHGPFSGSRV